MATPKPITLEPQAWPNDAGWLVLGDNVSAVGLALTLRALKDVGITETPLGSNRGVRIERYLRRAGVPESLIKSGGGYWCAAACGAWFVDCGVPVPKDYAACDSWIPYLSSDRKVGSAILYGLRGDAHHIGLVVRLDPIVLTIEGNRSYAGTASNNGVACDIGPLARKDILGYIHPETLVKASRT